MRMEKRKPDVEESTIGYPTIATVIIRGKQEDRFDPITPWTSKMVIMKKNMRFTPAEEGEISQMKTM